MHSPDIAVSNKHNSSTQISSHQKQQSHYIGLRYYLIKNVSPLLPISYMTRGEYSNVKPTKLSERKGGTRNIVISHTRTENLGRPISTSLSNKTRQEVY